MLERLKFICQKCGEGFWSVRLKKPRQSPAPDAKYCDACRRKNSPWGKNDPFVKKKKG